MLRLVLLLGSLSVRIACFVRFDDVLKFGVLHSVRRGHHHFEHLVTLEVGVVLLADDGKVLAVAIVHLRRELHLAFIW